MHPVIASAIGWIMRVSHVLSNIIFRLCIFMSEIRPDTFQVLLRSRQLRQWLLSVYCNDFVTHRSFVLIGCEIMSSFIASWRVTDVWLTSIVYLLPLSVRVSPMIWLINISHSTLCFKLDLFLQSSANNLLFLWSDSLFPLEPGGVSHTSLFFAIPVRTPESWISLVSWLGCNSLQPLNSVLTRSECYIDSWWHLYHPSLFCFIDPFRFQHSNISNSHFHFHVGTVLFSTHICCSFLPDESPHWFSNCYFSVGIRYRLSQIVWPLSISVLQTRSKKVSSDFQHLFIKSIYTSCRHYV